ncbi:MAG: ABC transporter permease subunit [Hyphomonadaceae bacterium]|nr:ABC transporter permease subunit [Clostridia bacterium]
MLAIFKREFKGYFTSPIGFIFVGIFLFMAGLYFYVGNLATNSADIGSLFRQLTFVLMFLTPIHTMRLLSEERRAKLDQLLLTSPVSILSIVFGKFLAAFAVLAAAAGVTVLYTIIFFALGAHPSFAQIIGNYVGFLLMAGSFIAIGLFISSLTVNQVVAAVVSYATFFFLLITGWLASKTQDPNTAKVIEYLSPNSHYRNFSLGIFNVADAVYYLSMIALFVFLTVRVIEKRRWS